MNDVKDQLDVRTIEENEMKSKREVSSRRKSLACITKVHPHVESTEAAHKRT